MKKGKKMNKENKKALGNWNYLFTDVELSDNREDEGVN